MLMSISITSGAIIYRVFYEDPLNYISVYCKLWYYLQQSFSMTYRWMLCAACLDRYACSSSDARLRRFANVHIARRVVTAVILIWIVFPIPLLILYNIRTGFCVIVYGYGAALYNGIFIIMNASIIPISTMTTCTFLIRRNLVKKRYHRRLIVPQQQNIRKQLERRMDQQALVLLFAQVIVYIILTVPWMIYSIYNAISLGILNKSSDRLAIEQFLLFITGTVNVLFPTASFYLYTLTSCVFRKEFLTIVRSVLRWPGFLNQHRIEPMQMNVIQGVTTIPRPVTNQCSA